MHRHDVGSPVKGDAKAKILNAALRVIRTKGFGSASVDDICREAGVSKGAFFHHFTSKEDLAIAAAAYFSSAADAFFAAAAFTQHSDARERLLGYIDQRSAMLQGEMADFTCLLGTMVQEVHATHPAIRDACDSAIRHHASDVARDIELARATHAPSAPWDSESLSLFTQAVIQGAFILAKAHDDPAVAADCISHLRRYIETQLPKPLTP